MGKWKWLISLGTTSTAAVSTPITVVKVLLDNDFEVNDKSVNISFKKDSYTSGQKFKRNNAIINDLNEIFGDKFFDENEEIDDEQVKEIIEKMEEIIEEIENDEEYLQEGSSFGLDDMVDIFKDAVDTISDIKDIIDQKATKKVTEKTVKKAVEKTVKKTIEKEVEKAVEKTVKKAVEKVAKKALEEAIKNGLKMVVAKLVGAVTFVGAKFVALGSLVCVGLGSVWSWIANWFSSSDNEQDQKTGDDKISEDSNEQQTKDVSENALVNLNTLMNIHVRSLKNVEDFKEKIIIELKQQSNFTTLNTNKVTIKKSDGITELTDSDLVEGNIIVKIKMAITSQTEFIGEKDLTVTWLEKTIINLSDLKDIAIRSSKNIREFKANILDELKQQSNFTTLNTNKVTIKKSDGITELTDIDLVEGNIIVKIKVAIAGQTEFIGEKKLTVNWTEETNEIRKEENSSVHLSKAHLQKNLNDLPRRLYITTLRNIEYFKTRVLFAIRKQFNLPRFNGQLHTIEVKRSDGITDLKLSDLVAGKIEIKIKSAVGQTEFIGTKSINVYWSEYYDSHKKKVLYDAPSPNNLNDLSGELYIRSLKNVEDFKTKILDVIGRQFNFLRFNGQGHKIEIKRSDGVTDLKLSDLVGGKIEIKIKSAVGQTEFIGTKSINVHWSEHYDSHEKQVLYDAPSPNNLNDLSGELYIRSLKNVEDFKTKVLDVIGRQFNFLRFDGQGHKIEIKRSDGVTDLKLSDLVDGKIEIKIKSAVGQTEFIGTKSINVHWSRHYDSHEKQELYDVPSPNNLNDLSRKLYITTLRNIEDFKTAVLDTIGRQFNFLRFDEQTHKIEIKKSDGITDLTDSDLIAKKIRIKIIASTGQTDFIGAKSIKVYWKEKQTNEIRKQ